MQWSEVDVQKLRYSFEVVVLSTSNYFKDVIDER